MKKRVPAAQGGRMEPRSLLGLFRVSATSCWNVYTHEQNYNYQPWTQVATFSLWQSSWGFHRSTMCRNVQPQKNFNHAQCFHVGGIFTGLILACQPDKNSGNGKGRTVERMGFPVGCWLNSVGPQIHCVDKSQGEMHSRAVSPGWTDCRKSP